MRWLDRIMGRDFIAPEVGQVWVCGWNGEGMRVCDVTIHRSGTVFVTCQDWQPAGQSWGRDATWGVPYPYATGLDQWRRSLRAERRTLVPLDDAAGSQADAPTPPPVAGPPGSLRVRVIRGPSSLQFLQHLGGK